MPLLFNLYWNKCKYWTTILCQILSQILSVTRPIEHTEKPSKWSPDEDAKIILLRQNGMKWEDIFDASFRRG